MSDPHTEAALIIGIDDEHIHTLAADLHKPLRADQLQRSADAAGQRLTGSSADR